MRDKVTFNPNEPVTVTLAYREGKVVDGRFGQQVMYSLEGNQVMFLDMAVSQKINMLQPEVGESFVICKRPKNGSVPGRWDIWLSPDTEKLRAVKEAPGAAWNQPRPGRPVPPESSPAFDQGGIYQRASTPPSDLELQLEASLEQIKQRRNGDTLIQRRPPAAETVAPPIATGTHGPVPMPMQRQNPAVPIKTTFSAAMTEFLLMAGRATKNAEVKLGAEGGSVRFDSRDVAALATTAFIQAAKEGWITWRPGDSI